MLPASNRGAGMNFGMPDVCLTPAVPAPIPVPYPNLGMNAMAAPFSVKVLLSMQNALNLGSKIPITSGDEAGTAHPFFKQMGSYTMGSPKVFYDSLPAIHLTNPTTGNMMNNALGMVTVPSVTTVFLSLSPSQQNASGLSLEAARALGDWLSGPAVQSRWLSNGWWWVRPRFVRGLASELHTQRERERAAGRAASGVVFDLRDNPGGMIDAAIELLDDYFPVGTELGRLVDEDGDETVRLARYEGARVEPLLVLVDERTASAAELFAGTLRAHGRAILAGTRSYGKDTVQSPGPQLNDQLAYATCARFLLPGGVPLGAGLEPDSQWLQD